MSPVSPDSIHSSYSMADISKPNNKLKWQQSFPADPTRPSLLTTLPAELRAQIFEYILVKQTSLESPINFNYRQWRHHNTPRIAVEVLMTCKQLHAEGAAILYSQNKFLHTENDQIAIGQTAVPRMPVRYSHLVRNVTIDMTAWPTSVFHDKDLLVRNVCGLWTELASWSSLQYVQFMLVGGQVRYLVDEVVGAGSWQEMVGFVAEQAKALGEARGLTVPWEMGFYFSGYWAEDCDTAKAFAKEVVRTLKTT